MINLFFGYEKNVARTSKALGIQNPIRANFVGEVVDHVDLNTFEPLTFHICLPWEGPEDLQDYIEYLLGCNSQSLRIYHILEYKQDKNDYNDL